MILCVGTTPAAQRVMVFSRVLIDQVNRARQTIDGAAGKAINVAKVLQVLGANPLAVGFLGGEHGRRLRQSLEERSVRSEFITVETPTRQCVTVIDESTGAVTELVEESRAVDPSAYGQLMSIVERRMPGCQAVVMSGTIASGGPTDLYYRCVRLAHQAQVLSVVDAAGNALKEALKAGPGLVKPNRAELENTCGRPLREDQDLMGAMTELHLQGARRVLITRGSEPALAFDGQQFWRVISPKVPAVNPIGSGDAFTAGLVWRLSEGAPLDDACRWAAAAGAANALTLMAGEVDRRDLEALLPKVVVEPIH